MRTLFAHSGNMYGGVERVLGVLAGPDGTPLGPHFAVCFEGRFSSSVAKAGAPLSILGPVRLTRPDQWLAARRRLAALMATTRPDALVVSSVWSHLVFSQVARKAGLPVILWVHDVLSAENVLERLARRHAPDLLVCNSVFSERAARAVFQATESIVIYCPAPVVPPARDRSSVRADLGAGNDARVILSVGRMERYKGHPVLIEALATLRERTDWTWWCTGGPQNSQEEQYFASLRAQVRVAGLESRVRFLGSRHDIADLMGAADLFCHPNQGAEPFGLVLIEAMQAGLPVVASDLGGPAEIVTDTCGRLVPSGDATALARTLQALLDDGDERRRLGSGGPARALALCDPAARIQDLEAAIARVVAVRRAA